MVIYFDFPNCLLHQLFHFEFTFFSLLPIAPQLLNVHFILNLIQSTMPFSEIPDYQTKFRFAYLFVYFIFCIILFYWLFLFFFCLFSSFSLTSLQTLYLPLNRTKRMRTNLPKNSNNILKLGQFYTYSLCNLRSYKNLLQSKRSKLHELW